MALSTQELAGAYGRAWAAHDVRAILALHTPESVLHIHGVAEAVTGPADLGRVVTAMFAHAPDLQFATAAAYLGPDHIVLRYTMSGTAGGEPFACDGADVIAVAGGLVARKDTYLDLSSYERQGLGQLLIA